MTGTAVVVDLTAASSGCAERVSVWHTGLWDGRGRHRVDAPRRRSLLIPPYLRHHPAGREQKPLALGSYNARVPTLSRAEVRQAPGTDGAVLILVTNETDYASTERSPDTKPSRGQEWEHTECKWLVPQTNDRFLRQIRALSTGGSRQLGGELETGNELRGTLLNAKLGLVSQSDSGDRHLILMNRSENVRHGGRLLGPTSGGVIELAAPTDRRDADPFGAIGPLAGLRREVREELGLGPDEYSCAVHAVFQANSRSFPAPTAAGVRYATGELVSTVLALGTTTVDREGFRVRRIRASPATGLHESRGLVFVPIGDSARDLATALLTGRYDPATNMYHRSWERGHREIEGYLDQAALVAAIYVGAMLFGPDDSLEAFRAAMQGVPWWSGFLEVPDVPGRHARVVRHPRSLHAQPSNRQKFDAVLSELFPSAGSDADQVFMADAARFEAYAQDGWLDASDPTIDAS